MNAEVAAMRTEDRRKELNSSAQQGSVNPPNNAIRTPCRRRVR
jgi:hypothetical protein